MFKLNVDFMKDGMEDVLQEIKKDYIILESLIFSLSITIKNNWNIKLKVLLLVKMSHAFLLRVMLTDLLNLFCIH